MTHARAVPRWVSSWRDEPYRWDRGEQDPRLLEFGDRIVDDSHLSTYIHISARAEIRSLVANADFSLVHDRLRSTVANESDAVREFSAECRMRVVRRPLDGGQIQAECLEPRRRPWALMACKDLAPSAVESTTSTRAKHIKSWSDEYSSASISIVSRHLGTAGRPLMGTPTVRQNPTRIGSSLRHVPCSATLSPVAVPCQRSTSIADPGVRPAASGD